jgi:hypothetical protein
MIVEEVGCEFVKDKKMDWIMILYTWTEPVILRITHGEAAQDSWKAGLPSNEPHTTALEDCRYSEHRL